MITKILKTTIDFDLAIDEAVEYLRNDEIIAFPTETVYGVGVRIFSPDAAKKIFELKGRDFSKPLSAHIGKLSDIRNLTESVTDDFYKLAEMFLPGPLTIVVKCKSTIPKIVTGGTNTIGIRYPNNDIAVELAKRLNEPIAATSANISHKPSSKCAAEVLSYFDGKIPIVVDPDTYVIGMESTVIKLLKNKKYELIREGYIRRSEIEDVLHGRIQFRS